MSRKRCSETLADAVLAIYLSSLYIGATTVKLCSLNSVDYVHGNGDYTESKNSSISFFCHATELAERHLRNATS
jgi:hypothetical protein